MKFSTIVALGCLVAAPPAPAAPAAPYLLSAQQQVASRAPDPARPTASARAGHDATPEALAGPRLQPQFQSYHPALKQHDDVMAAAASTTTITISTLGLVLIAVLLILLLT